MLKERNYSTVAVDRETHKKLRIAAAMRGTNVKSLLASIVTLQLDSEGDDDRWLAIPLPDGDLAA